MSIVVTVAVSAAAGAAATVAYVDSAQQAWWIPVGVAVTMALTAASFAVAAFVRRREFLLGADRLAQHILAIRSSDSLPDREIIDLVASQRRTAIASGDMDVVALLDDAMAGRTTGGPRYVN